MSSAPDDLLGGVGDPALNKGTRAGPDTAAKSTSSGNSGLTKAKRAKNDEFYTRIEDIERELVHYRDHFRDKVVLLNCDDPEWSNFWRYFELNFEFLGLKKLISTHYTGLDGENPPPSYKLEIVRGQDLNGDGKIDGHDLVRTELVGDGDFRSAEGVALLKEADIVVTNPPFSLFREYVSQLIEHDKKFVILGNMNAVTYKEIWPLVQRGELWWGPSINSGDRAFRVPAHYPLEASGCWQDDEGVKWIRVKGVRWFTNLDHSRRHEEIPLFRKFDPDVYPRYDNYDAINVDKVADIPVDYDGEMGVPITFLGKHNPGQFELVGSFNAGAAGQALGSVPTPTLIQGVEKLWNGPVVSMRPLYKRVVVRRVVRTP